MKMPAEDVLYQMIQANADLKRAVADRVFPEIGPDSVISPWIVYHRISHGDATSHDGFDDLTEPVFQVTLWTNDAKERKLLGEVLRGCFRMRREILDGVEVVTAIEDGRDLVDHGPPKMYGACIDISVSL